MLEMGDLGSVEPLRNVLNIFPMTRPKKIVSQVSGCFLPRNGLVLSLLPGLFYRLMWSFFFLATLCFWFVVSGSTSRERNLKKMPRSLFFSVAVWWMILSTYYKRFPTMCWKCQHFSPSISNEKICRGFAGTCAINARATFDLLFKNFNTFLSTID